MAIPELLSDTRARTLALVEDLTDEQLVVQYAPNVNPFLWELGHVAFFYDAFVRGFCRGETPLLERAPRLYDSFRIDHADRWGLALPSRAATLDYMARVAEAVADGVGSQECERTRYCVELAMRHEDMHCEAFVYMRNFLGYRAPGFAAEATVAAGPWPGDVDVPAMTFALGADPEGFEFAFDNEKWAHPVEVEAFSIARAPVTNAEFAAFVADGGYEREELWSFPGWVWRVKEGVQLPSGWSWCDGEFRLRCFADDGALSPHHPVTHVSYYEAEAFCRWAGRRLPSEVEWEVAACFDPARGRKTRYPWGDEAWAEGVANLDHAQPGGCGRGVFPRG